MRKKSSLVLVTFAGALLAQLGGGGAHAGLIGPVVPYFGLSDSPFFGLPFTYFNLDTFETSGLSPGVTASAGGVIPPGAFVDSVEGPGALGHSWFSGNGAAGITFTFDKSVLGQLPTDVGIVWTDGDGPNRTFEAFDQNGNPLGTIIDKSQLFFSSGGDDDPANYRLFGASNPGGISSIFIANDNGGIEVDDLQFGFVSPSVPEASTWAMMLLGFAGLAFVGYRKATLTAMG
jgi:hypothetical protein